RGRNVTGVQPCALPIFIALLRQRGLEPVDPVEMVLERSLVAPGDHENIAEAGIDGLFDDVLDRRLVDDGKHLLGGGLGRRKETEIGRASCWERVCVDAY